MQDGTATRDGAAVGTPLVPASSITDWRLSQVFGGDKAPDEEILDGLQIHTHTHTRSHKSFFKHKCLLSLLQRNSGYCELHPV